jgi:hypothetical protein
MNLTTGNRIDGVLAAMRDAASTQEVADMMRELRKGGDDVAVVGAYRLQLASIAVLQPEHEGLMRVQPLNLSCAPQVVELIRVGELHGVLVTKIEGVSDAELRSASFGAGMPLTTEEVRESLRSDVSKLRNAGLWNEYLERGGAWYLNPETKRVVIAPWSRVAPADQRTLQEGYDQVLRMIDDA